MRRLVSSTALLTERFTERFTGPSHHTACARLQAGVFLAGPCPLCLVVAAADLPVRERRVEEVHRRRVEHPAVGAAAHVGSALGHLHLAERAPVGIDLHRLVDRRTTTARRQWTTSKTFICRPLEYAACSTSFSFWVSLSVPLNRRLPAPSSRGKTR